MIDYYEFLQISPKLTLRHFTAYIVTWRDDCTRTTQSQAMRRCFAS